MAAPTPFIYDLPYNAVYSHQYPDGGGFPRGAFHQGTAGLGDS